MTGSVKHSVGHTYQCLLYSIGTVWPMGIPCIGPYCVQYFIWVWWAVSGILMLKQVQQVSGVRATAAVLSFPIALIVLVLGGYFYFITTMIGAARATASAQGSTVETNYVVANVISYAASHNGQGPAHAVQLVSSGGMGAAQFVAADSQATESSIPVSGMTLGQLQLLPPNRQRLAAQAAADALPSNVIAHRVGDFVFTYHGINLSSCDPGLWIVIRSLDPDSNPTWSASTGIVVGQADGSTKAITGNLAQSLAAQNQLRAKYNLAPLPDPATVTNSNPAASGP